MDLHLKITSSDTSTGGMFPAGKRATTEINVNGLNPGDWPNMGDATDVISAVVAAALAAHNAGPVNTVTIEPGDDDEKLTITVNGEEVGSFNHDEHGWEGMDIAVSLAAKIAEACGAEFEDNR